MRRVGPGGDCVCEKFRRPRGRCGWLRAVRHVPLHPARLFCFERLAPRLGGQGCQGEGNGRSHPVDAARVLFELAGAVDLHFCPSAGESHPLPELRQQAVAGECEMPALRRLSKRPEPYLAAVALVALGIALDATRPADSQVTASLFSCGARLPKVWPTRCESLHPLSLQSHLLGILNPGGAKIRNRPGHGNDGAAVIFLSKVRKNGDSGPCRGPARYAFFGPRPEWRLTSVPSECHSYLLSPFRYRERFWLQESR